jgi:YD repeat-containing protein
VKPPPGDVDYDFDSFSNGTTIQAVPDRSQFTIQTTATKAITIGVQDPTPTGLGGWTLSAQHLYDPLSGAFWGGDGTRRVLRAPIIAAVPGTSSITQAAAVAANGTIYAAVDSAGTVKLDALSPSGSVAVVAGGGSVVPPYPACTPAHGALLNSVYGVAVTPTGKVYLETGEEIELVDPVAGTIQTVAGSTTAGCTDAQVARQGTLGDASGPIALGPDGTLYIVDGACGALRALRPDGSLRTISTPHADTECAAPYGTGQSVTKTCLTFISGLAVAADGTIYVASQGTGRMGISRIDAHSGVITNYAAGNFPTGSLLSPKQYDGVPASQLQLAGISGGLAVDPTGNLYVADYGAYAIYQIDIAQTVHLIAGGGGAPTGPNDALNGSPALSGAIGQPSFVTVDPNGSLFFLDNSTFKLRAVIPSLPTFSPGTTGIPSLDGSEVYLFSGFGQHLSTIDPVTGATLRTFGYDSQNRLTSVVETRGGTTTLAYSGTTVTITPPFSAGGQQTTLTLDQAGGHILTVTTPAGEATSFSYSNGLMTSLLDPKSNLHTFAYDPYGRLTQDVDPTHATTVLASTPVGFNDAGVQPDISWTATRTSPAGHVMTQNYDTLTNNTVLRNLYAPSGAASLVSETTAELWTTVAPDGTTTSTQQAADPQFGMLDAYAGSTTRKTPSGLTYSAVRSRTSTGSSLAPSTITDVTTINGQSEPWSSAFTAAAGTTPAQWLFKSPASRERLQKLDSLGRVTSISYPGTTTLPTTSFVYDADGLTVTPGANGGGAARVTSNTYDTFLAGYLATSKDPLGNVTTYDQRDQDGRVLDVELPDFATVPASHVSTTYDENGNVTSVTVPPSTSLPSTHTFTSTPVDLLASYTPPQVSNTTTGDDPELATLTTSYSYNPDRQVTAVDTPEGTSYDVIAKTYDAYGRLGTTYDPLSNVTATYEYVLNASNVSTDQVGSIVTSDGVTVTNTFDGFLKKKTLWASSSVNGSVNWTYETPSSGPRRCRWAPRPQSRSRTTRTASTRGRPRRYSASRATRRGPRSMDSRTRRRSARSATRGPTTASERSPRTP